jgi:hypothetical protein
MTSVVWMAGVLFLAGAYIFVFSPFIQTSCEAYLAICPVGTKGSIHGDEVARAYGTLRMCGAASLLSHPSSSCGA